MLEQILADPLWLSVGFNPRQRELHFLRIDDDTLERAAFLDQRSLDMRDTTRFPLADVLAQLPPDPARAAPALVFHSAFCCSTLLARCLPVPGRLRALRELTLYAGLATARDHPANDLSDAEWQALVAVTGWLSSRPFADGSASANKPTNVANPAAADLMRSHPAARAVLMYSDLPSFLVSNAKHGPERRTSLVRMYAAMDPAARFATRYFPSGVEGLDHLQVSALLWHYQMQLFHELDALGFGARLRRLDAEEFLAAPDAVVQACQRWFGVVPDAEHTRERLRVELGRHAKDTRVEYDPNRRKHETGLAQQYFGEHMGAVIDWSASVFGPWEQALPRQAPLTAQD